MKPFAKRLWPLWALLAAGLLWWAAQPGRRQLVIVLEGSIDPELEVRGGADMTTTRPVPIVCRPLVSLLTVPSWHNQEAEGHFERLEGGHYRFRINLGELPSGGLCRWRLEHVGIGVNQVSQRSGDIIAVWPPERLDPAASRFDCYPRGNTGQLLQCHPGFGALPDLPWEGEVRMTVNLTFHPEGGGERPLGPG